MVPHNARLAKCLERISTEAFDLWWQHKEKGTEVALPHFERVLPALAKANPLYSNDLKILNWLVRALGDTNREVRINVVNVLGSMGAHAAEPGVVHALLQTALGDEYVRVRVSAIEAIGKMGEKAASPELRETLLQMALGNEKVVGTEELTSACATAARALGEMREKVSTPEVLGRLVEWLGDDDYLVRNRTVYIIKQLGDTAATPEMIHGLFAVVQNELSLLSRYAAEALVEMREKAATKEVIDGLLKMLHDPHNSFLDREEAANKLGQIGKSLTNPEKRHEILCALQEAQEDANHHQIRSSATGGLGHLGETGAALNERQDVIRALRKALENKISSVRLSAVYALRQMRKRALNHEVVQDLVRCAIQDEDDIVRRSAAEFLGMFGEESEILEVARALQHALMDESSSVRSRAAEALGKLGAKAATMDVINALERALMDSYWPVGSNAVEALGEIGANADNLDVVHAIVHTLCIALGHQDSKLRCCAPPALHQIGQKAASDEVVQLLLKATLQDDDSSVRQRAVRALGSMGKQATPEVVQTVLFAALHETGNNTTRVHDIGRVVSQGFSGRTFEAKLAEVHMRYSAVLALEEWEKLGLRLFDRQNTWTAEPILRLCRGEQSLSLHMRSAGSFPLPKADREALDHRLKSETNIQIHDRAQCIRLKDLGRQEPDIAEVLGLDQTTVRDWISLYVEKGLEALCDHCESGHT